MILWHSCRANQTTVQGAISAASAIAMSQAQQQSRPLPQTLLLQCPANMRQQVLHSFQHSLTTVTAFMLRQATVKISKISLFQMTSDVNRPSMTLNLKHSKPILQPHYPQADELPQCASLQLHWSFSHAIALCCLSVSFSLTVLEAVS